MREAIDVRTDFGHDPSVALQTAQDALPDGDVRHYPQASHPVNGEEPEQVAADIRELLSAGR